MVWLGKEPTSLDMIWRNMYLVEQHFLSSLFPNRKPGRWGVIGRRPRGGQRSRYKGKAARCHGKGLRLWGHAVGRKALGLRAGTPQLPFHETNRSMRRSVTRRHRRQTQPCALSGAGRSVGLTSESHTSALLLKAGDPGSLRGTNPPIC